MSKQHQFSARVEWTGNLGSGSSGYQAYERSHTVSVNGKPDIAASSDPVFRGDGSKHNPEDFMISALAGCHMLWYLHLCADAGVVVLKYADTACGILLEVPGGGGHFSEVTLNPVVTVADASMMELANTLHKAANAKCFIANSVNFAVKHNPQVFCV